MPQNGGTAEYSNLINSLSMTSTKIDDVASELEFQFSQKLGEEDVDKIAGEEQSAIPYIAAIAGTVTTLKPVVSQVSPLLTPATLNNVVDATNRFQQGLRIVSATKPAITAGGLGGIVTFLKGAVATLAGMAGTIVGTVLVTLAGLKVAYDLQGNLIEKDNQIRQLQLDLNLLTTQVNRINPRINSIENGLVNVEFTANEALSEVTNLEDLIKKNHAEATNQAKDNQQQIIGQFNGAKSFQEANFDFLKEKTEFTFRQIKTQALQQSTATLARAAIEAPGTKTSDIHRATVGIPEQAQADGNYQIALATGATVAAGTVGYAIWKGTENIKAALSSLGGTISGGFNEIKNQGKKLGKMLNIGKIMDAVTLIITLHNALMLSRDIGTTLFSVVDNGANFVLNAMGIKSIDDEGVNTGQAVKKFVDNAGKQIFGVQAWAELKNRWAAASAIVSAGSTLMWSIRDFADTTNSLVSMGVETTGAIGNALRKSGVTQDIGTYFPEQVSRETALQRRLLNAQNIAGAFESITSSLVASQQSLKEIDDNNKELKKKWDENIKTLETGNKNDKQQSKGKDVSEEDAKPSGDDE